MTKQKGDTITVLFSHRHHIGSVLIRAWMRSRFSHCAVSWASPMTGKGFWVSGSGEAGGMTVRSSARSW